jgi:hypothetical protein
MSDKEPSWRAEQRKQYHKDYLREYRKKRKVQLKEKGICPNCEKRPAAENRTCCQQCLDDKKLTIKFGTAGPYRQLYADLFEKQQGLCGICLDPMKRPVLDHCHRTMAVRGLLCSKCNIGIGQFNDSPEILQKAIRYVSENTGIGIYIKPNK